MGGRRVDARGKVRLKRMRARVHLPPPGLPFGFTFTDFSQHNMFPRVSPLGGNMEAEILREPWEDLEVPLGTL